MKRITRIIRPIICMAVLLFAMTTAVMGCYQKETEPIDIPGRTPSGTSAPQPSATPAGEVILSVDRQAELAEARAKNPDTVAWLYIPGTEVDDPVVQAKDNAYYLQKDENGNYKFEGRFNQGVVSLNLPQIGILARGDEEKFWQLLDQRLQLCFEALMCRHNALKNVRSDSSPIHWQYGAIAQGGPHRAPALRRLLLHLPGLYRPVRGDQAGEGLLPDHP